MAQINPVLQGFGERLKDVRVRLGLTQPEFAKLLDVKRQTISSWEQGSTTPDVGKVFLLKSKAAEEGLRIDLGELLGESPLDSGDTPLAYVRNLLKDVDEMGIRGVFHNRGEALDSFRLALEREVDAITIVSSSLTGVLRVATAKFAELLRSKACSVREFRVLMTEPREMSRLREAQEGRSGGSIESEIRENVARVVSDWKVRKENVRFYRGAPTVFLLFTSERMLLNPYTYQTEAFKTLTLEVARTGFRDDIYSQYVENHFQRPWDSSNSLSYDETIPSTGTDPSS